MAVQLVAHRKDLHDVVQHAARTCGAQLYEMADSGNEEGGNTRHWKSDFPLVFAAIILPMTENVHSSNDIQACIERWVELWYQGRFAVLVDDTTNVRRGGRGGLGQGGSREAQYECAAWASNCTPLYGKIRQEIWRSTIQ